jgi:hypothetical protein
MNHHFKDRLHPHHQGSDLTQYPAFPNFIPTAGWNSSLVEELVSQMLVYLNHLIWPSAYEDFQRDRINSVNTQKYI